MSNKMWGILLHLGYNMWCDNEIHYPTSYGEYSPYLRCDKEVWDEAISFMVKSGLNTVVIDLGDGIAYQSHPEIGVVGAWSVEMLKEELHKIKALGILALPKLNFSTGHDAWLGPYSRMVSTPIYYQVCKDLINEVCDIFDTPRYFHLGLDEENAENQAGYSIVNFRRGTLLWHDINFLLSTVKSNGVTPWIWADFHLTDHECFLNKIQNDVLLSNWYYWNPLEDEFNINHLDNEKKLWRDNFLSIERDGYRQVPTGSNYFNTENIELLVKYCHNKLNNDLLNGFLICSWEPTIKRRKYAILESIDLLAWAKKEYEQAEKHKSYV